jgi:hypothetical protein
LKRADCIDGPRPCHRAGCAWHMLHMVDGNGKMSTARAATVIADMDPEWSCVLDVASRDDATTYEIGDAMRLSHERVHQIEAKALWKLRRKPEARNMQ